MTEPTRRPRAQAPLPDRPARPEANPLVRLALDLGPLVAFFLAYALLGHNIFLATGLFMACTAAAMLVSKLTAGRVSPMLWFSGVMVLLMGGATLFFHDETFIKIKPTLYYAMVAAILGFGLWSGRPTLQLVLGSSFPGLTRRGWRLLTRNWALFFAVMAIANEIVWRHSSTSFWLGYKLWGVLPATLLFGAANLPMLLKHGLNAEPAESRVPPDATIQ